MVHRHAKYNSLADTSYRLKLQTSQGNLTLPLSGDKLRLIGRDSKIYVTDYDVGTATILYSTAEVFTWLVHMT